MEQLPDEIMKNIVGYASPFDSIALSNACKTLHSQLALSVTTPMHVLSELATPYFHVPRFQEQIHSIVITLRCQDFRRRRNRRGKVYVVDEEKQHVYSAVRIKQRLRIVFQPNKNESYHLRHSYGAESSFQVKQQTLSSGENIFSGKAHHFLVKITTGVHSQLLDEAMGRVNEMTDDRGQRENEMAVDHGLVDNPSRSDPQLLDQAMERANEMADDHGRRGNETTVDPGLIDNSSRSVEDKTSRINDNATNGCSIM